MTSTLGQMKRDLIDYLDLHNYPLEFKKTLIESKIDELIFIKYLESTTDKNFLKWISETPYVSWLIRDLHRYKFALKEHSQTYDCGNRYSFQYTFSSRISENRVEEIAQRFGEMLEAKYKNHKAYYNETRLDQGYNIYTTSIMLS